MKEKLIYRNLICDNNFILQQAVKRLKQNSKSQIGQISRKQF